MLPQIGERQRISIYASAIVNMIKSLWLIVRDRLWAAYKSGLKVRQQFALALNKSVLSFSTLSIKAFQKFHKYIAQTDSI